MELNQTRIKEASHRIGRQRHVRPFIGYAPRVMQMSRLGVGCRYGGWLGGWLGGVGINAVDRWTD